MLSLTMRKSTIVAFLLVTCLLLGTTAAMAQDIGSCEAPDATATEAAAASVFKR